MAVGAVADCGKIMLACLKFYGSHIRDNRTRLHRNAACLMRLSCQPVSSVKRQYRAWHLV